MLAKACFPRLIAPSYLTFFETKTMALPWRMTVMYNNPYAQPVKNRFFIVKQTAKIVIEWRVEVAERGLPEDAGARAVVAQEAVTA